MSAALVHRGETQELISAGTDSHFFYRNKHKGVYQAGLTHSGSTYVLVDGRARTPEDGVLSGQSLSDYIHAAYQKHGVKALADLDGGFAVCIYNTHTGRIVLGRDLFALRPLRSYDRRGVKTCALPISHSGSTYVLVDGRARTPEDGVLSGQSLSDYIHAAYQKHGVKALADLDGGFAVCIYNTHTGRIVLGRDLFARRPLYYAQQDNHFWFASEVKAILNDPQFKRRVNTENLL